jgi:hypothetical protein
MALGTDGTFAPLLFIMALFAPAAVPVAHTESLTPITVEAQREHDQLAKQVSRFVNSAFQKPPAGESMLRWEHAVCPLVAGVTKPVGESILYRFSATARDAHVPLGSETCKPNLFIIFAKYPAQLLKLWWRRSPRLFNTEYGIAPAKKFIEKDRPVRVWYNVGASADDNASVISSLLAASTTPGFEMLDLPAAQAPSSLGSRLTYLPSGLREIGSAVIVIDPARLGEINIGQLTDYVTMLGLMELNQDADFDEAPTILRLFAASHASVPAEKTNWDQALLASLYATAHGSRMQMSQIQSSVVEDLETNSAKQAP